MAMPEAVVVLGAAGFVGRHLVPALAARGYEVHPRARGQVLAPTLAGGVRLTHVVNLAGRTYVPDSWDDPVAFYQDNVVTTAEALRLCRSSGAALVHVSSYVYGTPQQLPIAETHPLSAFNPYAHSKILGEAVVDFHRAHLGVRAAVVRPFNLYGPGQDARFVVPTILRQLLDPTLTEVAVGDPTPRRDYLYIDDFVALLLAVVSAAATGTYNAGSGGSVSVAELAREAGRAAAVDKPLRGSGIGRPNEILDVIADIAHARAELGWRPRVSLIDGLRSMVAAATPPTRRP